MKYIIKLAGGGEVHFFSEDLTKTMTPNSIGMIEVLTSWVNCGISPRHYTTDVEYKALINPTQIKLIVPHGKEI